MKQLSDTLSKNPFIFAQMHEHALKISNYDGLEFYKDGKKLIDGLMQAFARYDFNFPNLGYDVYNIEPEALGQKVIFAKEGTPQLDHKDLLISREDDLLNIKLDSPIGDNGRFKFVIEATKEFINRTGYTPHLQFTAPFSLAAQIYGMENLIMNIINNPAFVHRLMSTINQEVLIPWISYQLEIFPEAKAVLGADALASPPNLNLAMLEEFVVPYILQLKKECGEKVGVVNWWGESLFENPVEFLDIKKQVAPNNAVLRIQDPDLHQLDLDPIIKYINREKLSLTLGIGAQVMSQNDQEEIVKRLKKYITAGLKTKDFALYFCSISKATPIENVKLAINYARQLVSQDKFWAYWVDSE